jgi:hypothetical protein
MEFIHGTTLVYPKIRMWGGEKKASRDVDITLGLNGKLPPKTLLDLGRKKIFPPKALDPLGTKRRKAERVCLLNGTRFMGGYAVPDEFVDDLALQLEAIQKEFEDEVQIFLINFDTNKNEWLVQNEEFSYVIRDQVPDRDSVAKTFQFQFHLYKVNPLGGFEPDEAEIANQVLREVGQSCKQMSDRMLDRKRSISGLALGEQLDPLINKLDVLSFGNSRILTVLGEFRRLQEVIPVDKLDKDHPMFGSVLTFLAMCSDGYKLEMLIDGNYSVSKLIAGIRPAAQIALLDSVPGTEYSTDATHVKTSTAVVGAYF